jgi:hypothetical protein
MPRRDHSPGTLKFEDAEGRTFCSPEFAARVTLEDCQPSPVICILRRVIQGRRRRLESQTQPDLPL